MSDIRYSSERGKKKKMILIIEKIVSIFLIMAIGFFANRIGVLPKEANDVLTSVLIKIITPCMLISSITSKELSEDTVSATIQIFCGGLIFFIVCAFISFILSKYVFHIKEDEVGTYAFTLGSINSGFMGFPVTLALFGSEILYFMVIHNITLTVYMYSFGPVILAAGHGRKSSFNWHPFLKSFLNINTIVSFISIIMLFAGLHLPSFLFDTVESVGDATVPISMLLVGLQLGQSNPLKILKNGKMVALSLIKMLTFPVLTFLAVNWLPLATSVKVCMVFAAVFPAAVAAAPVTSLEGKDPVPSAEMIAFTTLVSVATIPLFAALITAYYL